MANRFVTHKFGSYGDATAQPGESKKVQTEGEETP
jgi:hypothetical protein